MVSLEKRVSKVENNNIETDTEFEAFISRLDDFIQEMHEENQRLAEIRILRQQNRKLVEENEALKNELLKKSSGDKFESITPIKRETPSSDEYEERFNRRMRHIHWCVNILRLEAATMILFDIYMFFFR